MTIGEKVQLLRRQRGWSQERLAEELSVSRQALSRWEQGTAVPDTVNVQKLSRLFGVSTDFLLDDGCDMPETGRRDSAEFPGLTDRARRLVEEKGPAACFLLAGECALGLLAVCFVGCAYLSALSTAAPLREFPVQAFIPPAAAAVIGILLLVRIAVYLLLAARLKRLRGGGRSAGKKETDRK